MISITDHIKTLRDEHRPDEPIYADLDQAFQAASRGDLSAAYEHLEGAVFIAEEDDLGGLEDEISVVQSRIIRQRVGI